ncbi:hypothetical protein AGMMS50256_34560 [Betaproteobacteria bacterium]|nr:hypothetical protein AGMMS50256_34560 [Betaproteobacteria bacterium]
MLTDARGVPLSVVVCGANRHDVKSLPDVLDAIVIPRPPATEEAPQNLCTDASYVGETAKSQIEARGYIPHVCPREEEINAKAKNPGYKPRRWVVEACHSWLNRFRKLLVRYEKTHRSYMALVMIASAMIAFRKISGKINIIYG